MRQAGRQGQIDTTKGQAYKVRWRSFILFLFTTDYCNSTMTRDNLPCPCHLLQCQPPPMNPASWTNANTVSVIESHTVRDFQGFCNPCGLWVGYTGVRVQVGFSNPSRTHTPGAGWWVTCWLPTKLNLGFRKLDQSLNQDQR